MPLCRAAGNLPQYPRHENLLITCKRVFVSLFTNRAISYRVHQGFKHMEVALSDWCAANGAFRQSLSPSVMFTLDTESGFRDAVFITGAYGLGKTSCKALLIPMNSTCSNPRLRMVFAPLSSVGADAN